MITTHCVDCGADVVQGLLPDGRLVDVDARPTRDGTAFLIDVTVDAPRYACHPLTARQRAEFAARGHRPRLHRLHRTSCPVAARTVA